MIRVDLTGDHHRRALELCATHPVYAGSHRGEAANEVGFLGEIVVQDYLAAAGVPYRAEFTTRHDLVVIGSGRLEVKTKDRTVSPRPDFDCSVPLYNHDHQDVAYWIFVSLLRDKRRHGIERFVAAYIVGACNREMLAEHGVEWRAGETDSRNGTTFWTDCRNIEIRHLRSMQSSTAAWLRQSIDV